MVACIGCVEYIKNTLTINMLSNNYTNMQELAYTNINNMHGTASDDEEPESDVDDADELDEATLTLPVSSADAASSGTDEHVPTSVGVRLAESNKLLMLTWVVSRDVKSRESTICTVLLSLRGFAFARERCLLAPHFLTAARGLPAGRRLHLGAMFSSFRDGCVMVGRGGDDDAIKQKIIDPHADNAQ
jgi:hypothetical protein